MIKKDIFKLPLAIVAVFGSIAGIINSTKLLKYLFFAIMVCAFIYILITLLKSRRKVTDLLFGEHPALIAAEELIEKGENNNIIVSKLIKNVKYSDNNKTSNVTYIITGECIEDFCGGFYLPISGGRGTSSSNIEMIGYSLIRDEKDMINQDAFLFYENPDAEKILSPFKTKYNGKNGTACAKKFFLPFPNYLKKGDKFQAVFYYTWKNSIINSTDSTSYYTSTLFPNGVKKLITNLFFTSRPYKVSINRVISYRILGSYIYKKKQMISNVENIKQENNSFVIRWERDNPEGIYILERTLEERS